MGKRTDGIRDFDGLRQRSVIDDETGCWNVTGYRKPGSSTVQLWSADMGAVLSLTALIAVLMTGKPAPRGVMWFPTCGNPGCGNPAHRKRGTRAEMWKVMRPALAPQHKAKITVRTREAKGSRYSAQLRSEIMGSAESCQAIGQRLNLCPSAISRIRRGEIWRDHAAGASVFSLGSAA